MTVPSRTYEHLLAMGWRPCLACGSDHPTRVACVKAEIAHIVIDPNDDLCWRCAEEEQQRRDGVMQ